MGRIAKKTMFAKQNTEIMGSHTEGLAKGIQIMDILVDVSSTLQEMAAYIATCKESERRVHNYRKHKGSRQLLNAPGKGVLHFQFSHPPAHLFRLLTTSQPISQAVSNQRKGGKVTVKGPYLEPDDY